MSAQGEDNPDKRGTPMEMTVFYRQCASQCLVLSDYTRPGPHTLVALIIYVQGEFLITGNDLVHCYLLVGVTIRLSLRMGLHRDSSKIDGIISVYEAEMRRRTWCFLIQIDLLASFHVGLPGMVQTIESDSAVPRNLRDEDFHQNSTELPAGRPESEMTPMSYTLCKGRILNVFGQIAAQANRISLPSYEEVMQLDAALNQAYDSVPGFFRVIPLELAITDSTELIVQRYSIAILYHKSRCVLHRKYLMNERNDHRFAYSKAIGLDASMQILDFQSSTHEAVQPGGLLFQGRWLIASLSSHDFLLAATIVYLSLVQLIEDNQHFTKQCQDMINALERSYTVWKDTSEIVGDSKKAFEVLNIMVTKIRRITKASGAYNATAPDPSTSILELSLDGEL
jgi:hypothetical protein